MKLRIATKDDLSEIFSIIQTVGKEMDNKNSELFAYSNSKDNYLHMLEKGVCTVAEKDGKIIASLLTRPEDNRDKKFDLSNIPKGFTSKTIEFCTCQVLKEFRGNKLEQQLIDFTMKKIGKLKKYEYAICTVSPNNKASLKSVLNSGFVICAKAEFYGGKTRYVLTKQLKNLL